MTTLLCTARLLRRLHLEPTGEPAPPAVLGDWYGTFLTTRPEHLAICVNELTLLTIVVPLAPRVGFETRFISSAAKRLRQIRAPKAGIQAAVNDLEPLSFGKARNRSVLASLNSLGRTAKHILGHGTASDAEDLGRQLCETPMFALAFAFPWEEAASLLSGEPRLPHLRRGDAT